jgi:hypothetical protein
VYPTLLAFCNEMSATLARLLAYLGAIFVLGVIAAKMCGLPWVEAAVEPASAGSRRMIESYRAGGERQHFADPASEVPAPTMELGRADSANPALRGPDWFAASDPQLRGRVAAR